jgi:maltodextrin utilization protein YvdJ
MIKMDWIPAVLIIIMVGVGLSTLLKNINLKKKSEEEVIEEVVEGLEDKTIEELKHEVEKEKLRKQLRELKQEGSEAKSVKKTVKLKQKTKRNTRVIDDLFSFKPSNTNKKRVKNPLEW